MVVQPPLSEKNQDLLYGTTFKSMEGMVMGKQIHPRGCVATNAFPSCLVSCSRACAHTPPNRDGFWMTRMWPMVGIHTKCA